MLEFKFPDVGEGITEGTLLRWLVAEGDQVNEHQVMEELTEALRAQDSGLPPGTRQELTFDRFQADCPDPARALEAAKRWARSDGPPLLTLAGPPGVGKTQWATRRSRSC